MDILASLSLDQLVIAALACVALREAMAKWLPRSVVGPEGWLLRLPDDA